MNVKPLVAALRALTHLVPAARVALEVVRQGGPVLDTPRVERWLLTHAKPFSEVVVLQGRPPVKLFLAATVLEQRPLR